MKKMNMMMALGLTMSLAACADRSTRVDSASAPGTPREEVVVKDANRDATVDNSAHLTSHAISFAKGSAVLSEASRAQLRELVRTARARGDIEDIKVSVWSDREMTTTADLPRADRDLAARRADVIEDFLEDTLDTPSVETFSMATRANWLARMFNTNDAELKSSFAKREYDVTEAQFALLRQGKASQAVVVIESEYRN